MANQWFRLYSEFASDPKVQSMTEAMQRRLIILMCLRCGNGLVTLQHDEIAVALRISNEELDDTKALFLRKGFIDEQWNIINWDKRQFTSDSSAARVARHRENKKRECNVTVTPPDTDTDTDTDTEEKQKTKASPVKRANPSFPADIPEQLQSDFIALRKAKKAPITQTALDGIGREANKAGVSLKDALEMCCQRGWTGFKAEWVQQITGKQSRSVHDERKEWLDKALGKRNERDITSHATRLD